MKHLFFYFFLCAASLFEAQETIPPPIKASSSHTKSIIIDKIIIATDFENYFTEYCKRKINQKANEDSWDKNKTNKIIQSVNFKFYKPSIYNAFAFDSEENLKEIFELFKKINTNRQHSMSKLFPFDALLQYNLEGYVKMVIDGKYIEN
ncbi:hypothetical protein [Chryseobacterium sp. Leaf201]|uniref:hypothetical protein n=1 Tax=Chryseobacterium sp. Leaf201 TaxID=1735672 RepID=UPI0006FE02FD|nr:hypothetical protein [Chryseobacterium sp. Leaf201]KQM30434.1 hypothetical protein ASE55_17000 [Chryseobacterium sp. Leaf201]